MIRAGLVLCTFIFGSVYGYQEMGQIDTDKHVFFLRTKFHNTEVTAFGYQVQFPEATKPVLIMAIESWKVDQNKTKYENMNCDQLKAESTWYQVVSSCDPVYDDMYGSMMRCNSWFEFKGKMFMEYQFAFAVCEGQRLRITSYDLTSNPMKPPKSSSATSAGFSFITLLMLIIFVI